MAWSDPPTFTAATLTASQMNQYVRDNTNHLKGIADGLTFSAVRVSRSAATSITNAAWNEITFTAEAFDYGSWWSSGTDIVVPAGAIPAGYTTVAIQAHIRTVFAANATGSRHIRLLLNGTSEIAGSQASFATESARIFVSDLVVVAAADILTLELYQDSGGALDATFTQATIARFAPVA